MYWNLFDTLIILKNLGICDSALVFLMFMLFTNFPERLKVQSLNRFLRLKAGNFIITGEE